MSHAQNLDKRKALKNIISIAFILLVSNIIVVSAARVDIVNFKRSILSSNRLLRVDVLFERRKNKGKGKGKVKGNGKVKKIKVNNKIKSWDKHSP